MNLFETFSKSAQKFPKEEALVIEESAYTYSQLKDHVSRLTFILNKHRYTKVAIFAYRSLSAYSGILATLQAGKTYVPLNPKFPENRNKLIIELSGSKILIVDKKCLVQLNNIAEQLDQETVILAPEIGEDEIPSQLKNLFKIYSRRDFINEDFEIKTVDSNQYAYIMFTSGTTGIPKGVPVSHENVLSYINYLTQRYEIRHTDKFSQTFDLTFDLSVHDLFLSWNSGASLYVIPEDVLMAPAKFVREKKLTMWFSVPSLAQFMSKFRMLKEGIFPHLRFSLFCGEPLPKTIAVAWQKAAPNSILENIYGPTEATIGITHYRLPVVADLILENNGVVSIGQIFPTQDFCLIDENSEVVENEGELCLSGSQLTSGYYENPEKTREQYFSFDESGPLWYKTGDIVKVENDIIYYKSRKDFQVKVRGYRIELDEINLAISKFSGTSLICTIPYPIVDGVADSLYSFLDSACTKTKAEIINYLSSVLPEYMVPKDIIFIEKFPLNSNGKIDRKQLYQSLK